MWPTRARAHTHSYHVLAHELQKLRVKYFGDTVSKVSPERGHGQGDGQDPMKLFLPDNPHGSHGPSLFHRSIKRLRRAGSAEGDGEDSHARSRTVFEIDLDERNTLRDVKVCLWSPELYARTVLMRFAWLP